MQKKDGASMQARVNVENMREKGEVSMQARAENRERAKNLVRGLPKTGPTMKSEKESG